MKAVVGRLASIALLVTSACACGVGEDVVARVGGRDVEVDVLQGYLAAATGMNWQSMDQRVASRLLDQFLDQEVVAVAAMEQVNAVVPIDPGPRSARVRALMVDVCGPVPPLDERLVEQAVAERAGEILPARAHVRQMLLDDPEAARSASRRLDLGESFLDVSRDLSRAPNAEVGGELGYLSQGTLPPGLDEVVFALAEGEVSEPVETPSGYHIFQVLEVVPEGPAALSEIELSLRMELTEELTREFTRQCVARMAAEVGVAVYPDHLWFQYEGRYGGEAHGS